MSDLTDALEWYRSAIFQDLGVDEFKTVLAAARRVAEAPEVWWCEVHDAEGSDIACWKRYTQYPRLPSGQDCRMVRKLLVDPPEENHAAGS